MAAVAPNDLVRQSPSQILLKCTICPKKPTFSDLSHLLTHVGSKGHLSQLFKLTLRPDMGARQTLADYNDWYAQHGIGNMLANRQTEKEKKELVKTGGVKRPRTSAGKSATPVTPSNGYIQSTYPVSQAVPGLMMAQCNMTPTPGMRVIDHPGRQVLQSPAAQLAASAISPNNGSLLSWGGLPSPGEIAENSSLLANMTVDPDLLNDKDDVLPNKALKGPTWPGMGSFDAASEEQRRKRNQRKDESVLNRMIATSANIEPTEYVWAGLGNFQRTRHIYDPPSLPSSPEADSDQEDAITPKDGKKQARRSGTKAKGKKTTIARPSRVPPRGSRISKRPTNAKGKRSAKGPSINSTQLTHGRLNTLYHNHNHNHNHNGAGYNTNNHGDDGDYIGDSMYTASPYAAGPLNGLGVYNSSNSGFFPASEDGSMFPDSSDFSPYEQSIRDNSEHSPNRTESPWDDNGFDSQRTALQSMNPNNMHLAMTCQLTQPLSSSSYAYLPQADAVSSGFPSQSQSPVLPADAPSMASQSPTLQSANFFAQQHIGNDQYHGSYTHQHGNMGLQPFNYGPTVSSAEAQSPLASPYQSVQTSNTAAVGSSGSRSRLTYNDFQSPYSGDGILRGGHSEFNI